MKFGKIAPFLSLLILVILTSFFGAFFAFFYMISEGEYAEYPRTIEKVDTTQLYDYLQSKVPNAEASSLELEAFCSAIISENFASKKIDAGHLEQVPVIKIEDGFLTLKYIVKIPFIPLRYLSFFFKFEDGKFHLESAKLGEAKLSNFMAKFALNQILSTYKGGEVFDLCAFRLENTKIKLFSDKILFEANE